jgi:hypothetical protein
MTTPLMMHLSRYDNLVVSGPIKKPPKLVELGGLHPVFLAPEKRYFFVSRKEMRQFTKAGLLASPPFQSPSHPASAEKWQKLLKKFSCYSKRPGLQRRDHSRLSRDSLLSLHTFVKVNNK